jgi:hypothetical protein
MIAHWSDVFNLPINQELSFPDKKRVELALNLIREEFAEFQIGVINRDITEVQDSLGDLLWVTVRAMMEFGVDPQETIESIYESNMSKVDYTEEDALKTRAKYQEQNINTYMRAKNNVYVTHRLEDDKVLKSHNFKHPVFTR